MFVFAPSLFWKSVNKPLTLYFLQSRQETLLRLDLKKKKAMQTSRLTRPLECISRKQAPKYIRITN